MVSNIGHICYFIDLTHFPLISIITNIMQFYIIFGYLVAFTGTVLYIELEEYLWVLLKVMVKLA